MDWFKQNPFLGGLAAAAAVVVLGGGYMVFSEAGRLGEEQSNFEQKTMQLDSLRRGKPFPDEANVAAAEQESRQAAEMLATVAKELAVKADPVNPQAFQDELSKAVQEIARLASEKGVTLPEKFYLGFESYEAQPPSPETSTALALQLRSIRAVAKALIDSHVTSLEAITRSALPGEASASADRAGQEPPAANSAVDFSLAPFDVSFTAEQPSFRLAFNRILELSPPVFVKLVAVRNSAPAGPPKIDPTTAAEAAPTEASPATETAAPGIKPVLGRESLHVDLRLASISTLPHKH